MDEFKDRLKQLIEVSTNPNLSEKIKKQVYKNFEEDYNPYNQEPLSTIQDVNTKQYIIKAPLGGMMTIDENKIEDIVPKYKYFTDEEIFFMRTCSYDIVHVKEGTE